MKKIDAFKILGTITGSTKAEQLDEITIVANPETLRKIGIFLINAAYEMDVNNFDHMHLQDVFQNFSAKKHVDVIAHVDGEKK